MVWGGRTGKPYAGGSPKESMGLNCEGQCPGQEAKAWGKLDTTLASAGMLVSLSTLHCQPSC
jgi:hypothetical protein